VEKEDFKVIIAELRLNRAIAKNSQKFFTLSGYLLPIHWSSYQENWSPKENYEKWYTIDY